MTNIEEEYEKRLRSLTLADVFRVNQRLLTQEIINVQPMTAPSVLLFYLDYQYGSDKCPLRVGGSVKLKRKE